jgi:predicted 3-demethylubiquinone-9 3-methyltransferase (glyoxalase superfamily)
MKPKNTICLWFDKDAHEAARFYAATFPNSEVTAVVDEEDRRRHDRGGTPRVNLEREFA